MDLPLRQSKNTETQQKLQGRDANFHERGVISVVSRDKFSATWTLNMFKTHVALT